MISRFALLAGLSFLTLPSLAMAQTGCPEGDWFCEPAAEEASQPAPAPEAPKPAPARPPAASQPAQVPRDTQQPMVVDRPENAPPPAKKRRRREWGFKAHLDAALMGDGAHEDAGMGGLGLGFRYRPIRWFAFDTDLELLGGTDWNGYDRAEAGLLFSAVFFFNPRDRVQFYGLAGLGLSRAVVQVEPQEAEAWFESYERNYRYFGGQIGFGVEWRATRTLAISGDVLGFIRGRTDRHADREPEFIDPYTHRATNSSGGGLLRMGVTLYW